MLLDDVIKIMSPKLYHKNDVIIFFLLQTSSLVKSCLCVRMKFSATLQSLKFKLIKKLISAATKKQTVVGQKMFRGAKMH